MPEIKDWQIVRSFVMENGYAVLDLRGRGVFLKGHLPHSVNSPLNEPLPEQLPDDVLPTHLLPPRHDPLLLIGDDGNQTCRLKAWLEARGRERVEAAAPDWSLAPEDFLEMGESKGRLWKPPPWLEEHAHLLPEPSRGPVVDLGCGNGRAAVWLAERGYAVTAVDHDDLALERAGELAAGLDTTLTTLHADLTDADLWPRGPWSMALAFRFLHRPLLLDLKSMMRPGGLAVVRTFRCVEGPWTLPRRRFCLDADELTEIFAPPHWRILETREDEDDDGRPAAGVVALRV